jgi:hypothetical protein
MPTIIRLRSVIVSQFSQPLILRSVYHYTVKLPEVNFPFPSIHPKKYTLVLQCLKSYSFCIKKEHIRFDRLNKLLNINIKINGMYLGGYSTRICQYSTVISS